MRTEVLLAAMVVLSFFSCANTDGKKDFPPSAAQCAEGAGNSAPGAESDNPLKRGRLRAEGRWILDDKDRVVILNGVNLADSCKRPPFLPWQTKEQVQILRKWGFNSVRYLIVWEAVEPEPGRYDDAFLDQVAIRLAWCREAGLRVILDMHQDIWGRKFNGDGAPDWACLDNGQKFAQPKGVWSAGYLTLPVNACFDNFYANKPGPGGVGIQDRFIAAWRHVALRFKDDPNVIGYDLLNEPHYGSTIYTIFLRGGVILGNYLGDDARKEILSILKDMDRSKIVGQKIIRELMDKKLLMKMFDEGSDTALER
ncbi:MAG TPA: cellulase family glycosylhydrolase [Candidatus Brocadiia bacterium]|nr:cellulase family glycosylhydrolase [Candidatus Brocadiia bacterium]